MKKYIGTKVVHAEACEKDGLPGYTVRYLDGYVSWSPKEAFDQAYGVAEGDGQALSFGDAIYFLRQGRKLTRTGWNGKGMHVRLERAWSCPVDLSLAVGDPRTFRPLFTITDAQSVVSPWVPSTNDVLAWDWRVVE